jgi:hypothetical protein
MDRRRHATRRRPDRGNSGPASASPPIQPTREASRSGDPHVSSQPSSRPRRA